MAVPEVKQTATETRLAAMRMPQGGAWASAAREDALARVHAMGLPHRRDEYWKFTRPDTLVQADVPQAPQAARTGAPEEAEVFGAIDRLRIVFVDGVFDAAASDELAAEGVTIERLAEAATADIHWARDLFGSLESRGQAPVQRPLAALNTAMAGEGLLIHVTGKPARPLHVIYRQSDARSDVMLHHAIKLEPGAALTLLESGPAGARVNTVLEAEIGDGAALHHVRKQGREHARHAATHVFARLAAQSVFKSFTLTANGLMTRNEMVVEFTGDDAIAHVAGAAMGDRDFHGDDTVFITHDALRCESRQVFKKVLRNGATGVFQGKILVKPEAQKTDGYQISQSLLLDDDSEFLAKPELEIYADDVACSHGSTSSTASARNAIVSRSVAVACGTPRARR